MPRAALLVLVLVAACNREPLPSQETSPSFDLGPNVVDLAPTIVDLARKPVDLARADRPFIYDLPPPADLALGWCGGSSCIGAQYCLAAVSGLPGPTSYECRWVPAACGDLSKCDCMQQVEESCTSMNGAFSCQESGSRVTVTCAYP